MKYTPVEGNTSLVRDRDTGAILNTNSAQINSARIRKRKKVAEQEELQQLKTEVSEIKTLLLQVLGKIDG